MSAPQILPSPRTRFPGRARIFLSEAARALKLSVPLAKCPQSTWRVLTTSVAAYVALRKP